MRRNAILLTALLTMSLLPLGSAQEAQVTGQVLDQDGQAVAGADVYLYQWGDHEGDGADAGGSCDESGTCKSEPYGPSGYHEAHTVTDADGRFALPAIAASGQVTVYKDGHRSAYEPITTGSEDLTIELLRYPDKTARIEGRIMGAGAPLQYVSIHAENPEWGIYECSSGGYPDEVAIERMAADEEAASQGSASAGSSDAMIAPGEPYPGYQGCAIQIEDDGSFSGALTPGYTILRFYSNDWQSSVQYYSESRVVQLAGDSTTTIDVDLARRPGPDAVIEGYVLGGDGEALSGVYVSFSNQDSYGWAQAQTDSDGSYRVKLHSGYLQVSVWADGHFPWEGNVRVPAAGNVRFDIQLTPGQSQYGGCCYAVAEGGKDMDGAEGAPSVGAPGGAGSDGGASGDDTRVDAYEDLGGGLGPYDPAAAPAPGSTQDDDNAAPGFEIVAILAGLAAIVLLRRRR